MKLRIALILIVILSGVTNLAQAADCELESVQAALTEFIKQWNIDGLAVGTSFKATEVNLKPDSEGVQGTFTNVVELEVYEAGRGSTLFTSVEVDGQKIVDVCKTYRVR